MDSENTTPNMPGKSNGALIGTLIVILVLIIGGIYLFGRNQEEVLAPVEEYEMSDELSNSDELESIEADLEGDLEVDVTAEELE